MPFWRALDQSKTQPASSRFWIRVADSISIDKNLSPRRTLDSTVNVTWKPDHQSEIFHWVMHLKNFFFKSSLVMNNIFISQIVDIITKTIKFWSESFNTS